MGARDFAIELDEGSTQPLFAQIASAVADAIRDRRLNVNRNTVLAAYEELVATGWLVTRQAGGTYVADEQPERAPDRSQQRLADSPVAGPVGDAAPSAAGRRAYASRRDALAAALRDQLREAVEFKVPPGGTALWVRGKAGIDVEAWAARALTHGVTIETARQFSVDGHVPAAARLGFTALPEPDLVEAVRRFAAARPR